MWYLDNSKDGRREKRLNILYQVKLYRPIRHLRYLPRVNMANRSISTLTNEPVIREGSMMSSGTVNDGGPNGDRFIFSYESGEWDIFEVEQFGQHALDKKVHLVETDKSKEHEESLTSIDFHKNLNLVATSCEGGQIKIWSTNNVRGYGDKQLIREINFPSKVDSVCFLNEQGDILVGHERRLSVIKFQTYWPFRDERGNVDRSCEIYE